MQHSRKTGWVTHELFYWHDSGLEGPSCPFMQPRPSSETAESKRRLANLVAATPLGEALTPIRPRPATDAEVLLVHTPAYLARMQAVSAAGGGYVGHELHCGPGGYRIAALSCGGVLAAVEAVLSGAVQNAYALVRPPGHHAERDKGHGFCMIDNVAVAAECALRAPHGLQRVAIVDIDVHHGNGPEQAFYDRSEVLYISLHQDGLYPLDTGATTSSGAGAGAGYNVNIPLPPGCGIGAYAAAFERVVEPALRAHRPELILVSCGFDGSFLDPLGRMLLTSDDFRELTRRLRVCAEELCGGRLVFCHEGGYSEVCVGGGGGRRAPAGSRESLALPS
jgi:acetoin utilization deacetylase AcuC-like enzyme